MPQLELIHGDITTRRVDAIVNAANQTLLGGGGVDGAIHRRAGKELLVACRAISEIRPGVRCPTGEARITPGFQLPAKFVIHCVGPIYRDGQCGESKSLAQCYRKAMQLAAQNEITSIAFPAISCGVYGYPLDSAADIAVRTIRESLVELPSIELVELVAFDDEVLEHLRRRLAQQS